MLILNALVLGGCIALVLVWQLLTWLFRQSTPTSRGFSPEHVWDTMFPLYELYGMGLVVVLVASVGYGR